jgi:MFS family permease
VTERSLVLLFLTRILRLFAFGLISVFLVLYLASLGFGAGEVGLLLSLTLVGDTVISLWITVNTDRIGRRRMLILGALLMSGAGLVFALTDNYWLLLVAAVIGVISPSGNEVGPFLAIEQASVSQLVAEKSRTKVFAWYNLAGSFATAAGALVTGFLLPLTSYRWLIGLYAGIGVLLALFFLALGREVETSSPPVPSRFGLHQSRKIVLKLSALFWLDSFGGGFVMQSLLAWWLHVRFGADVVTLGSLFFAANILAGISALSAAWLAKRIGLIRTMVFTHIPSNILLILVPFMPDLFWASALLLVRFSISQMDVPTRQAYTMAVVAPDERSAAAGWTGIARTMGSAISPVLCGLIVAVPGLLAVPLVLAGGLKIVYDLLLYRSFKSV